MRRGMEMGADDYITKPFDATELLGAVESRLKRAGQENMELNQLGTSGEKAKVEDLLLSLKEGRNIKLYKRGQLIYARGTHPVWLYYILKGKVKTGRHNEDGKELITSLYGEGDFLGYAALLEGNTYQETAEAMEESEIAVIPREDFEELIAGDQRVVRKFIRWLSRHITEKEEQLLGLAYHSLRKKVADALVMLEKKYNTSQQQFSLDISRDSLAAIAGVAKESLIRTLTAFREEGLIDIREGLIVIKDYQKLADLLN